VQNKKKTSVQEEVTHTINCMGTPPLETIAVLIFSEKKIGVLDDCLHFTLNSRVTTTENKKNKDDENLLHHSLSFPSGSKANRENKEIDSVVFLFFFS
jgi:hypothetical protein